jgi:phage gpG-like protein
MPTTSEIPLTALPVFGEQLARGVIHGDYTPALEKVAIAAKADFKQRFATSTAPDGSSWPPLKGFRVRRNDALAKPKGGGSLQPLRDTGLLMASATAQGKGHVEEITSLSMEVGTNLDKAAVHQKGVPSEVWDGRPTKGKALAIPMTIEAQRAGSPRLFPEHLVLVWPKGKSFGWLVQVDPGKGKHNRRAKSILHYMLVPRVVIPKREFVGWSKGLIETTDSILQDAMIKLATETNGNGV